MRTPENLGFRNAVQMAVLAVLLAGCNPSEGKAGDSPKDEGKPVAAKVIDCTEKKGLQLMTCLTEKDRAENGDVDERLKAANEGIAAANEGIAAANEGIKAANEGITDITKRVISDAERETGIKQSD